MKKSSPGVFMHVQTIFSSLVDPTARMIIGLCATPLFLQHADGYFGELFSLSRVCVNIFAFSEDKQT